MADITAAMVKDLRERSGAGMMDCKKALTETGGDMEAAIDWLRTKGLAAAAKKSSRTAAEGLVGVAVDGHQGRGGRGQLARPISSPRTTSSRSSSATSPQIALATGGDVEALKAAGDAGGRHGRGSADQQHRHDRREPVSCAAPSVLEVTQGRGRAVRPQRRGAGPRQDRRARRARERGAGATCSSRSASSSRCTSPRPSRWRWTTTTSTPTMIERERAIATEKAAESGKPADIVAKMVEGAIAKFRKENALLSQLFVMDDKTTIADVVAKAGKDAGAPIVLDGLCPLPARRRHREGRERLRGRSRGGRRACRS